MDKETLVRMFNDIFMNCLSEEDLAKFAELEMAGWEPRKRLPDVAVHIDACADCAERYTELLTALKAEAGDQVLSTTGDHSFDLQFLSEMRASLWVVVKENVHRLATEIPILIQRSTAAFGPLPTTLAARRVTVAAGATRDASEPEREHEIESLQFPDASANLLFRLTPGPVNLDEQSARLVFQVENLQSGEPLAQVRVNLCDAQMQLLKSETTQADGRVILEGLVGDYVLRCWHDGQAWEWPIRLTADKSLTTRQDAGQ